MAPFLIGGFFVSTIDSAAADGRRARGGVPIPAASAALAAFADDDDSRYLAGKELGREAARRALAGGGARRLPFERAAFGRIYLPAGGKPALASFSHPGHADEDFILLFHRPMTPGTALYTFGERPSDRPTCWTTLGYFAGWCEVMLDIPVDGREVACEGRGDPRCLFLLAHSRRLEEACDNLALLLWEGAGLTRAELGIR